jgi:hypothetical protein
VNTYTSGMPDRPCCGGPLGEFVVAWDSSNQDGSGAGVFARAFTAAPRTVAEMQVNECTPDSQSEADVAAVDGRRFVIVWASQQDGSISGVVGHRFTPAGSPR